MTKLSKNSLTKIRKDLSFKKLRHKIKKTSFYKGPFDSVSFYFGKDKVMTPSVLKGPYNVWEGASYIIHDQCHYYSVTRSLSLCNYIRISK